MLIVLASPNAERVIHGVRRVRLFRPMDGEPRYGWFRKGGLGISFSMSYLRRRYAHVLVIDGTEVIDVLAHAPTTEV